VSQNGKETAKVPCVQWRGCHLLDQFRRYDTIRVKNSCNSGNKTPDTLHITLHITHGHRLSPKVSFEVLVRGVLYFEHERLSIHAKIHLSCICHLFCPAPWSADALFIFE